MKSWRERPSAATLPRSTSSCAATYAPPCLSLGNIRAASKMPRTSSRMRSIGRYARWPITTIDARSVRGSTRSFVTWPEPPSARMAGARPLLHSLCSWTSHRRQRLSILSWSATSSGPSRRSHRCKQACLRLCDIEGFTSIEAGRMLGMGEATVRTHLHRPRRLLRGNLDPQQGMLS